MFCCHKPQSKYERLDRKLEKRMIEIKKSASGQSNFRSINSIIMKFPQFKEGLKEIRDIFRQYGESFLCLEGFNLKLKVLRTLKSLSLSLSIS